MSFATALQPIFSQTAPICEVSKPCSAMPISAPPKFTPMSPTATSTTSTKNSIIKNDFPFLPLLLLGEGPGVRYYICMRIVSWNVNGIRAVHKKGLFVPFVEKYQPDIICLQEVKAQNHQSQVDLP